MIKRRVKTVGLGEANCHTFRATGITAYLLNGGTLERAQAIAAHESPRTTKLYDRTADEVTMPQEIRQAELRVQPLSGVVQVLGDECLQPQAFIQLAHQKEARV